MTNTLKIFLTNNPIFSSIVSDIATILNPLAGRWILIGAWARFLNLNHQLLAPHRVTRDLDFMVIINGWESFETIRNSMEAAGYKQQNKEPYRFIKGAIKVDLLPFSEKILIHQQLIWPNHDLIFDFLGAKEALSVTNKIQIKNDLTLEYVTVHGLVLLKIGAYMDRPHDRERDLEDIFFCFKHYQTEGTQRYELADVQIEGKNLFYEHAGAYLIGKALKNNVQDNQVINKMIEFSELFLNDNSKTLLSSERVLYPLLLSRGMTQEIQSFIKAFKAGVLN